MSRKSFIEFLIENKKIQKGGGDIKTIIIGPKKFNNFYREIKEIYKKNDFQENINLKEQLNKVNKLLFILFLQSGIQDKLKVQINELINLHNVKFKPINFENKQDTLNNLVNELS